MYAQLAPWITLGDASLEAADHHGRHATSIAVPSLQHTQAQGPKANISLQRCICESQVLGLREPLHAVLSASDGAALEADYVAVICRVSSMSLGKAGDKGHSKRSSKQSTEDRSKEHSQPQGSHKDCPMLGMVACSAGGTVELQHSSFEMLLNPDIPSFRLPQSIGFFKQHLAAVLSWGKGSVRMRRCRVWAAPLQARHEGSGLEVQQTCVGGVLSTGVLVASGAGLAMEGCYVHAVTGFEVSSCWVLLARPY